MERRRKSRPHPSRRSNLPGQNVGGKMVRMVNRLSPERDPWLALFYDTNRPRCG